MRQILINALEFFLRGRQQVGMGQCGRQRNHGK